MKVVVDTNIFDQRPTLCVWSELSGRVGYLEKKVPKVQRPEVMNFCAFSSEKISKTVAALSRKHGIL